MRCGNEAAEARAHQSGRVIRSKRSVPYNVEGAAGGKGRKKTYLGTLLIATG